MQGGGILPPEGKQRLAPTADRPPGFVPPAHPLWQPSSMGPLSCCHPMALAFTGELGDAQQIPSCPCTKWH